jgi:hypothetical protein
LALRGIDTKKGLLAAIATAAAPATPPATAAPTAAPPAGGSGHDKSGPQSANDNRYNVTRVLKSKGTKDGKKVTEAAEKQKKIDAAAAETQKLEQLEAAKDKAKLERIAAADANRLNFPRISKEVHDAAVLDEQFEGLRKKLELLRTKLSEEKIVPIYEPVKHVSASGCSTTSLSARPSFMEMMRILTAECGVKPNQLNLVCNVVYAALFEKPCEGKFPSVPCMVDWFDDLGEKDCELMIDFMTGVSAEWAVHIMSDSSRRSKAERHGVVCAMWDARTNMPFKIVAGVGTVDSCAGEAKAKVTYKILQQKGVNFEFTKENGWSFVAITDAAAVAISEMVHVRNAAELKLLQEPPGPVASLESMRAVLPKRVAVLFLLLATTVKRKSAASSTEAQKPRWIDATVKGLSQDGHVLTVAYDDDAAKEVTVDVREKVVAVIDEVPDVRPAPAPRAQRRIRHMISWTCDLHMLSLILVNACFAAFGAKGGMDHIHVLQLGYKFGYVCNQNWPKYKALLKQFFPNQATRMKKPQMLVETRWLYVLHNMATLLAHGVKKDDIIKFGMAMIQTLESTVMDRRIWSQIVEWLQIPQIQVAIFFIVEFGDTFLLEEFYRSEQADAEFELGEGFRLHRMPLTALERLLKLEAMAADVLAAFPETKSAMQTYFDFETDEQKSAATAEFTAKMDLFVQKAIVTLLNNSVRRAWDPHLLFALLCEPLVPRDGPLHVDRGLPG